MSEKFHDDFTMIMMMAISAVIIYTMICFAFGKQRGSKMKVYITVLTGKNARILDVYTDEDEATKQAWIYSVAYHEWVTVIEKDLIK